MASSENHARISQGRQPVVEVPVRNKQAATAAAAALYLAGAQLTRAPKIPARKQRRSFSSTASSLLSLLMPLPLLILVLLVFFAWETPSSSRPGSCLRREVFPEEKDRRCCCRCRFRRTLPACNFAIPADDIRKPLIFATRREMMGVGHRACHVVVLLPYAHRRCGRVSLARHSIILSVLSHRRFLRESAPPTASRLVRRSAPLLAILIGTGRKNEGAASEARLERYRVEFLPEARVENINSNRYHSSLVTFPSAGRLPAGWPPRHVSTPCHSRRQSRRELSRQSVGTCCCKGVTRNIYSGDFGRSYILYIQSTSL